MHISRKKLNLRLMETALGTLDEADLVLYVLDAARPPGPEEDAVAAALLKQPEIVKHKTAAAINKVDVADAPEADLAVSFLRDRLPELPPSRIFNISALKN